MTDKSTRRLRRFSLVVSAGLAIIGLLSWYRGHTTLPFILWSTSGILSLAGLLWPSLLLPVEKGWMALAMILAWLNTRIILGLLFFAAFAPTGIIMRFFRDPLDRRLRDGRPTYWIRKPSGAFDPKSYEKQF
jgi:Saxitoxin biosynthesis operon protein SxtJ